ncbi:MAG TPA: PAS domain S-box protein [Tepidiformaceae bacterium]|nr:PAS domain S-box protein [Tepidiformaceae bacterium]
MDDQRAGEVPPLREATLLFEASPRPMWVFDAETLRFLAVNQAALDLYGYTREEFLRLTPRHIRPPEDRARFDAHMATVDPIGVDHSRWRHVKKDGSLLSVEVSGQNIIYDGRPARLVSVNDFTLADSADAAREESEARYRTLIEHAPEAIGVLDVDAGTFVEFNENACRLFGCSRAVLSSLGVADVSPPFQPGGRPSAEAAAEVIERALRGETPVFEWLHRSASGEEILCEVRLVRLPSASRRLIRSSITDIRDRKAAELSASRLSAIVEFSQDAMMATDLQGRIITWNRGAERLFGYSAPEVLGQTTHRFFLPGQEHERDLIRETVIQRGQSIEGMERTRLRKDGTTVTTSSSYFPIRDPDGTIAAVGSVARDVSDRKAAELALRASEARFQLALRASRLGIWTWNTQTNTVDWSPEAAAILGRHPGEMPSTIRDTIGLIHPDDAGRPRTIILDDLASGNPIDFRMAWPSGTYRWVSITGMRTTDGTQVTGVIRDIHESKLAEAELRESEERFRSLADSAPIFIWTATPDRQIDFFNATWRRFTGRPMDQDAGYGWTQVIHPEDLEATLATYEANFEARSPYSMRYRLRRHDGEYRWILEHGTPRYTGDGAFLGFIGACLDIHETVLAEDEIRANEVRFRNLVETIPVGIWAWDGVDVLIVNAALERLLGFPREQLTRRDFLGSRIDPDDRAMIRARAARRMAGEPIDPPYVEIRMTDARDRVLTFELHSTIVTLAGQRVWLNSVIDVTGRRAAEDERRRLDHQMQQTQKLESLGILAGGIAHDFNNLLVAILGNAGLALLELPPESPARQTVQAIETAAQRAADLTRQMLAYSGKGKFVIEPLNLSRVVEEMAHLLEVSVSKRAVLKYHFAPNLPFIEADATQVRQVIMNLITNASDAIGDRSGVISISTGMQYADRDYLRESYLDADLPEGDYVYIEVADTGQGMDEATRARIFDPFFTTKFTGRGLGLAAVLGIIRGHRAAIKLYSEPGRGTTFKVLFPAALPASSRPPEPQLPPASEAEPAPRGIVLVVDDDETVRTVTRRILERSGFTVLLAADGVEALKVHRATPGVALVILDMTMPHMDGEECFRELRHLDPTVRVLLTSGYNEQDATERFVGKGLAGFIQKPYRPADLLSKVEEVLRANRG